MGHPEPAVIDTSYGQVADRCRDSDAREDQVIRRGDEQRLEPHYTAANPHTRSSGLDALAHPGNDRQTQGDNGGYLKAAGSPVGGGVGRTN